MATASKKSAKPTETVAKAGDDYVKALSEFQYSDLRLSRQQVFQLQGGRNDQVLLNLRYVVPVAKGTVLVQCAECGALFDSDHWLEVHGDQWHEYECQCGWSPQPGILDKDTAMRRHSLECPILTKQKEDARRQHVEQARLMQNQA